MKKLLKITSRDDFVPEAMKNSFCKDACNWVKSVVTYHDVYLRQIKPREDFLKALLRSREQYRQQLETRLPDRISTLSKPSSFFVTY